MKKAKNDIILKKTEGFYTEFYWEGGKERAVVRHEFGLLPANKAIVLDPKATFLWKKISNGVPLRLLSAELKHGPAGPFTSKDLRAALSELRAHKLIANKFTSAAVEKLRNDFLKSKVRRANYAGVFYAKDPVALKRVLKKCFDSSRPKAFSVADKNINTLLGIITPHSNIEISGTCAACAYKTLAAFPPPDLFILLGPNHSGMGQFPYAASLKDFETPLGLIHTDKDFCAALQKNCNFDIFADSIAHESEHSLELQLPFLQSLYAARADSVKIVAILCASMDKLNARDNNFIAALRKTVKQYKKKVIFIVTGDLMHRGWSLPSREAFRIKRFHRNNREIIRLLEAAEPENFIHTVSDPAYVSFCGKSSFYTFLRVIAPAKGKILNYTWNNKRLSLQKRMRNRVLVNRDVGHASMVFTAPSA